MPSKQLYSTLLTETSNLLTILGMVPSCGVTLSLHQLPSDLGAPVALPRLHLQSSVRPAILPSHTDFVL